MDVTIIDNDIDMIRSAEEFGFKIYYGDGTRLDVLHASGAHSARAIAVCIDGKESVNKIVELVKAEFPLVRLLVRLRVSVIWVRFIVPRVRMRTLGSACAKKRKKRLSILGSNSLNFGLNI